MEEIVQEGAFDSTVRRQINDNFATVKDAVVGPASATNGAVPLFDGVTGKLLKDGPTGVSAGPFTTITSITVVNGVVTAITGS